MEGPLRIRPRLLPFESSTNKRSNRGNASGGRRHYGRGVAPTTRDGFLISGWVATHPEVRNPSRDSDEGVREKSTTPKESRAERRPEDPRPTPAPPRACGRRARRWRRS
ncbi:hypothetical protein ACFPRL_13395 [Pseudoclavibacter helvolus]